jgi:hypothetical protein
MRIRRFYLVTLFGLALAWAQFRESGAPELAAHLELITDPLAPARVYLFKDGRPFRLSPVQYRHCCRCASICSTGSASGGRRIIPTCSRLPVTTNRTSSC